MRGLQERLSQLAEEFVRALVGALVAGSLEDVSRLAAREAGKGGGREREGESPRQPPPKAKGGKGRGAKRERRSASELGELVVQAVEAAAKAGSEGLAVGELARVLRRSSRELTRPLHVALQAGRLKKKGERRHTRYFPAK